MSILKYRYSEFEAAQKKLQDINDDLDDIINLTVKANETFVLVQRGDWAQAQAEACVQVETDARIFREAMSSFEGKFDSLLSDADSIRAERDSFVSSMGASVPDPDLVTCNTDGAVSDRCTSLIGQLDALEAKAGEAEDSLSGLRDSGAIAAAIGSVKTDVTGERGKVEDIRSAWSTLKSSASSFESSYSSTDEMSSSSLRSSFFITPTMLETVGADLTAAYEASEGFRIASGVQGVWSPVGDFKTLVGNVAKTMSAYDHYEQAGKFFGAMAGVIKEDGIGNFVKGLFSGRPIGNNRFLTIVANEVSGRPFSFSSLASVSRFSWSGFGKKLFEDTLGAPADALRAMRKNVSGLTDMGTYLKSKFVKGGVRGLAGDAPSLSTSLSKTAKFFKGFAKGVGVVGDAFELYGVFTDAQAAYQTTAGDDAQKTAAAVVEGGKGILKFGAGKAIGAAVGTCLGGPLGTVAGIFVGGLIDTAAGAVIDSIDTGGLVDGLANIFRGGKKSAFAAG